MPEDAVEATAPTRVDLAGGTLDIWPLYLFHPGAVTLNIAIDRRAWCRVRVGGDRVRIESKDTLQKVEAGSVGELLEREAPPLAAWVLAAVGVESGVDVVTQSRVPAGSGLGGSSTLAVVVAAAAARALGRELGPERLWPLVRDAEGQSIGVPTGSQDHAAAIHGGLLALHLGPGEQRIERLPVDPGAVEQCLLLVAAGGTRFSGINNWDVFKGQIDGEGETRAALRSIARTAAELRETLVAGRFEAVPELIAAEWSARKQLSPGVTTPEIDRIVEIAESHGGAAKVCGAGGGGVVAVWAAPGSRGQGPRERVAAALESEGLKAFPFRADLRGLEVEPA